MDVSIIVVAWNVRKLLYDCLKSVYDETKGIDFEVIYVDNASEDGSVEMVRNKFPDVQIIENDENKGFIKANNQGIEIATGRYILLLNSDTIVLDNAIAKTVKFADEYPDAAVVGPKILNPDKTLRRDCFMYPSALNMFLAAAYLTKIFPRSRFFGRERMMWWDFDAVREVQTVCGCCSLIRRAAIDEVGVMDPMYFVYGDDPDWCYRFKKAGWKIMFTPDAEIIHLGGQNTKRAPDKFLLQLHGSKLIFVQKHHGKLSFLLACLATACFFFLRVPCWTFAGLISRKDARSCFERARIYLIGGLFCLTDWTKLLMNKEIVCGKLSLSQKGSGRPNPHEMRQGEGG